MAPGQVAVNDWPLYSHRNRQYLELDARLLLAGGPQTSRNDSQVCEQSVQSAVGKDLRVRECAFWNVYLRELVAKTGISFMPFFTPGFGEIEVV
jgi:hypothetical protein